jgi:cytochrome c-type biogenesis protein CcmH
MTLDSQWAFVAAAAALIALALAGTLPFLWRGMLRRDATTAGRRRALWMTLGLGLAVPALAVALYALRGDIGAVGHTRAELSSKLLEDGLAAEGGATPEQVYAELLLHLKKQPDDPRAWVLKGRLDVRAERFDDAVAAYRRAVAGKSKAGNDAGVWAEFAEARALAQGGTLAGEPLELVQKALSIDGGHAQALDLAGSAAWEVKDYAKAMTYWRRLQERIPAGDPRQVELSKAIERAQEQAQFVLPGRP